MEKSNQFISIVVPCFNEAENIPLIVLALERALSPWEFEILLVDDGSSDGSDLVYRQFFQDNRRVKYLQFSRNFGHQAALKAGIDHAIGDAVVTIDADLQQPPGLIPEMIHQWQQGADIVEGIRHAGEQTSPFKRISSSLYYRVLRYLSNYPVVGGVSDFRLIDKQVANVVRQLPENHLYLRGLFCWMGFQHAFVTYRLEKRQNGNSRYSFVKMVGLATSGVTSMSVRPLRVALVVGSLVSLVAFLYALYALYISLFSDQTVPGGHPPSSVCFLWVVFN